MVNCITWIGMDDSAKKINIAIFRGQEESLREELTVGNDDTGLGRLAKKLKESQWNWILFFPHPFSGISFKFASYTFCASAYWPDSIKTAPRFCLQG